MRRIAKRKLGCKFFLRIESRGFGSDLTSFFGHQLPKSRIFCQIFMYILPDNSETVFEATHRGAGAGLVVPVLLRCAALSVATRRPPIAYPRRQTAR